jgi:hypothetical protein
MSVEVDALEQLPAEDNAPIDWVCEPTCLLQTWGHIPSQ